MAAPIVADIPHKLGKAGVRARIEGGVGGIADRIPGGGQVTHRWEGDTAHFTVSALGQAVTGRLTVFDAHVHAEIELPGLLGMFAPQLRQVIESEAPKLLR